ncbi:MAG: type IX secretion system membrane protein PorP/SprF [Salibacteraceae bacterium]|jgi:type IX secretion system PorP/SprF family membrane protein|nr:type IX secretion system membrane protein PorP/SprF [Salibacteraceae bacterium]MDP4685943.1 type IX secretion system membrane protein PorP/SprF [Salibacteraceae bacterium]MDP4844760.1 type IX secretion system membrane protein PorP/SprF [Salibacteraceae bacterium]MDP4935491.1 type IX secretion system membrane protein PorP/SprF [Salibacteraceae bacterium]
MRIVKNILTAFLVLVTFSFAKAQQAYQFSQYLQNQYLLNSATAGLHNYTEVNMAFRSQWVGIENSPQTIYASVTHPLGERLSINPEKGSVRISTPTTYNNIRRKAYHALGGYILRDAYGPYAMNIASLSYTYHLPIAKELSLSFSPNVSFGQTSFNQTKAVVELSGDPTYDSYAGMQGSSTKMDINVAFWLSHEKFFVGYSSNQLLGDRLELTSQISLTALRAHHNIIAGYHYKINRNLKLSPSVMLRYINQNPFSFDINLMADYKEWIWGGLSYRNSNSIIGMIGMNLSSTFKLGYSFDFTLSSLQYRNVGSHELVLGINLFNKEKAVF